MLNVNPTLNTTPVKSPWTHTHTHTAQLVNNNWETVAKVSQPILKLTWLKVTWQKLPWCKACASFNLTGVHTPYMQAGHLKIRIVREQAAWHHLREVSYTANSLTPFFVPFCLCSLEEQTDSLVLCQLLRHILNYTQSVLCVLKMCLWVDCGAMEKTPRAVTR